MALLSRMRHKKSMKPSSQIKTNRHFSSGNNRDRSLLYVHVAILQNGAALTEVTQKVRQNKKITLSSDHESKFAIPHYPLPNGKLDLLEMQKTSCRLNVESNWDGIYSSKGITLTFNSLESPRRELELFNGDYASFTRDDLRILVRVDSTREQKFSRARLPPHSLRKEWRNPFFRHFFGTREDLVSLGIACFAAIILVGSLCLGLASRNTNRPKSIDEIKDRYMVSFVAPQNIETAPEILQSNLDRRFFLRSIIKYYQSFARLISGDDHFDRKMLMSSSISMFEKQRRESQLALDSKTKVQREIDASQASLKDTATLSIPSVLGSSNASTILRVLDKIYIMHQASRLNLAAKRKITAEFNEDDPYDYDNYRNIAQNRNKPKVPEAIKQIHVWGKTDAEQAMYRQAESLAQLAQAKQYNHHINMTKTEDLTPANSAPIELPAGTKEMSFLDDFDFFLADERIEQIHGVAWGIPKSLKKQKEALTGEIEPNLIESYIKQNRYQLQLCYELALRRNEAASGIMEWRWRIDSRGLISEISLVASAIKDQGMIQCIQRKIATWRFPRPRFGSVEVSYPFDFIPSKG